MHTLPRTRTPGVREGDVAVPLFAAALATGCALALVLWRATAARRGETPFRVSLCLLVRDQADRLEGLLEQFLDLASRWDGVVADVVVVDIGSRDGTVELVRALGRDHPGLKAICWPEDGSGDALIDTVRSVCDAPWVLLAQAVSREDADRLEKGWPRQTLVHPLG
jgi:hypothetical protein